MNCEHQGFHTIASSYDREAKILTCFRLCDECGARLTDVSRTSYEPRFDPRGNDPYLTTAARAPSGLRAQAPRRGLSDGTGSVGRPRPADVTHRLTLSYGEFGWRSLESEAGRAGETLDELLGRAVAYFDTAFGATRAALLAPTFKPDGQGTPREIRLELTRGRLERLESEAGRQGITLRQLLEHAPLVFLADVHSVRAANRCLRSPGEA